MWSALGNSASLLGLVLEFGLDVPSKEGGFGDVTETENANRGEYDDKHCICRARRHGAADGTKPGQGGPRS